MMSYIRPITGEKGTSSELERGIGRREVRTYLLHVSAMLVNDQQLRLGDASRPGQAPPRRTLVKTRSLL